MVGAMVRVRVRVRVMVGAMVSVYVVLAFAPLTAVLATQIGRLFGTQTRRFPRVRVGLGLKLLFRLI